MREPAAAWSCRSPYCLAGLMAIPWDRTLLPQHAGICGSNHKSVSPRDLFLECEAETCEEGEEERNVRTTGTDKMWAIAGEHKKGKQGGKVQMAERKGRRVLPVFEAPKGALKFLRGRVKCMIHFPLLRINLLSSQHLPDSNMSSCSGHLQF